MSKRTHLSRRKYVAFALIASILSLLLATAGLLGVDLYLHRRFADVAGLNVWGYRGPVVGTKRPGERRIVVLGGSTAFGYGVPPDRSIPGHLQRILAEQRPARAGPVSVVNLAYNNEGAYAFRFTLDDYAYLDYDVVVLYTGYNDLGGPNTFVFRRTSPLFRLTGYMPILPLVLEEKAMALRHGGNLERAYRGDRVVFQPTLAERTTATALEAASAVGLALERQLGRLSSGPSMPMATAAASCRQQWEHYCVSVQVAVEAALTRGARVVIVTQPYASDSHVEQQAALQQVLASRYGADRRVRHANLGRVIDLRDRTLVYDGMHLTAEGNQRIAEALAPALLEVLD